MRSGSITSPDQIPAIDSPTLQLIALESDDMVARSLIGIALSPISKMCDTFTDDHIIEVSKYILRDFDQVKLCEIDYFVTEYLKGTFGKRIHKIDGLAVFQAFSAYYNEYRGLMDLPVLVDKYCELLEKPKYVVMNALERWHKEKGQDRVFEVYAVELLRDWISKAQKKIDQLKWR